MSSGMVGAVLILGVLALALVISVMRRTVLLKNLAQHGVRVTGTVIAKYATANGGSAVRGRRVRYAYKGPDGADYRGVASVTHERLVDCEEGGPIDLYVLPDQPGTSAPAWLVDEARRAGG